VQRLKEVLKLLYPEGMLIPQAIYSRAIYFGTIYPRLW
jgi:hypothetical protein